MEAFQFIGSLQKCGRVCRGGVSSCASHPLRLLVLLVALFSFGWGNAAYAETKYWYYGLTNESALTVETESSKTWQGSEYSLAANDVKTVKVDFASPCHAGDTSAETEYRGTISVKVGETDYTEQAKTGAPIPSGSDVTLTATAYSSEKIDGCPQYNKDNNLYFSFYAWKNRADGTILSTEPTYTISSLDADKDIIAVFRHASNSLTFAQSESSAVDATVNEGSTSTTKNVTFQPADAGKQYVIDVTNKYNSAISTLYNGSAGIIRKERFILQFRLRARSLTLPCRPLRRTATKSINTSSM